MKQLITLVMLTLLACAPKEGRDITSDKIDLTRTPDIVVTEFYKWYLDDYYNRGKGEITPSYVLKDNVLHLDTTNYMNIIRTCGFFSEEYIDNQIKTFSLCDSEMKKIDMMKFEECGCSPSEFTEHCEFMHYYIWLYHQGEGTKDIRIKKYKISGSNAIVDVDLYGEKGDSTTRYQTLHLTLKKENDKWKIDEIANRL